MHTCAAALILTSMIVVAPPGAQPQSENVPEPEPQMAEAIVDAAEAYIGGMLDGDANRVQSAAHPLLAKRRVCSEYWGAPCRPWLRPITHEQLPALVASIHRTGAAGPEAVCDVDLLSHTDNTASLRAISPLGVHLLHAALLDGQWLIVDDAYEPDPAETRDGASRRAYIAVRDYALALYQRDGEAMQESCHTSLVRRTLLPMPGGHDILNPTTYEELALFANAFNTYWGFDPDEARRRVTTLAVESTVAAARLDGENWTAMIHLARLEDGWEIIDVLVVMHAPAGANTQP